MYTKSCQTIETTTPCRWKGLKVASCFVPLLEVSKVYCCYCSFTRQIFVRSIMYLRFPSRFVFFCWSPPPPHDFARKYWLFLVLGFSCDRCWVLEVFCIFVEEMLCQTTSDFFFAFRYVLSSGSDCDMGSRYFTSSVHSRCQFGVVSANPPSRPLVLRPPFFPLHAAR